MFHKNKKKKKQQSEVTTFHPELPPEGYIVRKPLPGSFPKATDCLAHPSDSTILVDPRSNSLYQAQSDGSTLPVDLTSGALIVAGKATAADIAIHDTLFFHGRIPC